jgi:hypothetical protein
MAASFKSKQNITAKKSKLLYKQNNTPPIQPVFMVTGCIIVHPNNKQQLGIWHVCYDSMS